MCKTKGLISKNKWSYIQNKRSYVKTQIVLYTKQKGLISKTNGLISKNKWSYIQNKRSYIKKGLIY